MKKRVVLSLLLVLMLVFSSFAVYADEHGMDENDVVNGEIEDEAVAENGEMDDEEDAVEEESLEEEAVEEEEADEEEEELAETLVMLWIGNNMAVVNGESKELDVAPFIENERTMVPYRFIAEELHAEIDWDAEARAVTYVKGDVEIVLYIDVASALVNGEEVALDAAPMIVNDRTVVPLSFIGRTLGYQIDWDGDAKMVTISDAVFEEDVEEDVVEDVEDEADVEEDSEEADADDENAEEDPEETDADDLEDEENGEEV